LQEFDTPKKRNAPRLKGNLVNRYIQIPLYPDLLNFLKRWNPDPYSFDTRIRAILKIVDPAPVTHGTFIYCLKMIGKAGKNTISKGVLRTSDHRFCVNKLDKF
jgi:hypothetical protein